MKHLFATILAAACAAAALADTSTDVLVWYVDTSEDMAAYSGRTAKFDTIKFWAVDADNNKTGLGGNTYADTSYLLAKNNAAGSGETISVSPATTFAGEYYTDISDYGSGYTFLMELYLGSSMVDSMISALSLSDLQDYVVSSTAIENDMSLAASKQPYNFAANMIPEPTSGLLLLVGGALLALRRRRVS